MAQIKRYVTFWRVSGTFETLNGTLSPFCCGVTTNENGTILKEGTAPLLRRRFSGLHISRLKAWKPVEYVQTLKSFIYYENGS